MAIELTEPLTPKDVVELRIHGVSNTPPHSMLGVPPEQLRLVAGNDETGLYEAAPPLPVALTHHRVRAYSWGQLTSGVRVKKDIYRGLWMLLLPFAFANVALWAQPGMQGHHSNRRSETGGLTSGLIRLFSLTLTVTLALGVVGLSLSLVSWQWVDGSNVGGVPWLGFLEGDGTWAQAGRPIAVGMMPPILLMIGLWLIARRSFQYEAEVSTVDVPDSDRRERTDDEPYPSPFESRWFWRGNAQVRNLSYLHLAAGLSVITMFGLFPVLSQTTAAQSTVDHLLVAAGWVAAIVAAECFVAAIAFLFVRRSVQRRSEDASTDQWPIRLRWVSEGATGLGLVALVWGPFDPEFGQPLPWYDATVSVLAVGQVLLIGWIAVRCWQRRNADSVDGWATTAWNGLGAPLMLIVGWLLGLLYAAAVLYYAADYLNGAGNPLGAKDSIRLPIALEWAAAGLVPALVLLGAVAAFALRPISGQADARVDAVLNCYSAPPHSTHRKVRAGTVAKHQAYRGFIEDRLLGVAGWFIVLIQPLILLAVVLTVTGTRVVDVADEGWFGTVAAASARFGARILPLLGLALVGVAMLVYRDGTIRRVVGIVWDVATFWPRAGHPWAPPSYAERCVPQLATLIGNRTPGPGFILAGHSQGSVLSAATILQLPDGHRRRLYFLSFGTQLQKFYGRAFPSLFGHAALLNLAQSLHSPPVETSQQPQCLRWRSMWRPTDPIGYRIDINVPCDATQASDHTVDHNGAGTPTPLTDPTDLAPPVDEFVDPPIRGHSNYMADPVFTTCTAQAADSLSVS